MMATSRITKALLAVAVAALAAPPGAAAAPALIPDGSFDAPIYATAPPRDASRLFVVERGGSIRVVRDGVKLGSAFLDISGEVATDGERGLLSMAFPPDYETTGLFYVYLTAADPLGQLQVREYHRSDTDPDRAGLEGRIVWTQDHNEAANHNGGQIEFGPDGRLWIAPGDGGGSNDQYGHAQDPASQLGKLLRIDPRPGPDGSPHSVPADNPFGTTVWATGLRNPFRFSFDRGTGDLSIGDVGQGAREEIDFVRAADGLGRGANFGWSCYEGLVAGPRSCPPGPAFTEPVFEYQQGDPRAITGGYVVRDPGLPTLVGRYVYADAYEGIVRSLPLQVPRAGASRLAGLPRRDLLVSFGEDACGHVHVVSLNGTVERIQDGEAGPCVLKPLGVAPAVPGPVDADRTPPRVRLSAKARQRLGRRVTPRFRLTCDEPCRVTVSARLASVSLRRVRASLPAGRAVTVRMRPGRTGLRRLRRTLRRKRTLTLRISVTAADRAGNVSRLQRRLRVRR